MSLRNSFSIGSGVGWGGRSGALRSPYLYLPHDAVVPGGDPWGLAGALPNCGIAAQVSHPVDGQNRPAEGPKVEVDDISFEAYARDLESVVEATGIDRFALLGISQGCRSRQSC